VAVYVGLGLLGQIHFGPAGDIRFREALFVLLLAPEFFMPLRQLAINYHDRAAALGATDAILAILEKEADALATGNNDAEGAEIRGASMANDALRIPAASCGDFRGNKNLIEFNNVSKFYGERQVLTAINLGIVAGEKIALIGESGAGKTTLVNLLLGFEAVTEGQVLLNGLTVNRQVAAQSVAWVGQNAYIFHGSIKDNISLANPDAAEQRIINAAQAAGVTEFSALMPEGLLTQIGERGYGLSGGQVQRIALARAFLKNADIILLDEPTANLDATNKALLLAVIDQLFGDKTLIIATHDPLVINRMARRITLQQGRLVL
jgi:ATP-binding cassette subfamily C protein CydD